MNKHFWLFVFTSILLSACNSWQLANYSMPMGRYNHNNAEDWVNLTETNENGNETHTDVVPEIAHYQDLFLYKRRFEMVYYKQGYDSVVDFIQKGRWYMEKQNDSMVVVLNIKGLRAHQRFSFTKNANEGYFDQLIAMPSGAQFHKEIRVFQSE